MRTAFITELVKLAENDKDIVLITPDMGYSVLETFFKKFPERSFNCGIAEQNAVAMAAGMALMGKKPYVYSIIPFVTMRCFEQVRTDVAYMNTNVKLVGVGSGFTYGSSGATHHSIEDIAIMRALPNMMVCAPGDKNEAAQIAVQSAQIKSPMYVRLAKNDSEIINDAIVKISKASVIEKGKDIAIIATGNMLSDAKAYVKKLKAQGKKPYLISIHTIKPIDEKCILDLINKNIEIITMEEHSIYGGLSSAVAEIIAKSGKGIKLSSVAIPDKFSHFVGDRNYIKEKMGMYEYLK